LVISVKDTGIGILPEHLPRVFEMFSQVSHSTGRAQGGLGIGLALARGLIELHGGLLTAHSAGLDMGSEFIVRLPLSHQATSQPHTAAEAPTSSPMLATCRVLVVDDLRDSADSLAKVLEAMGHQVRVAYDGRQAVMVAEQFRPDVALIDLGMPDVDGYEVCRRIRAQAWGAKILLIAQTGWGQEFDRRRTQAAGFDQHLVKPLSWDAMDEILHRAATRSRD
jgi:CheY-like chemotaxis protein